MFLINIRFIKHNALLKTIKMIKLKKRKKVKRLGKIKSKTINYKFIAVIIAIIILGLIFLYYVAKPKVLPAPISELIGSWEFDEGTGDITIDSIGDNNGTIYGASWTEGISNFGLQFDGIDDYVDLGDDPILKPENVTASAWVNIPLGSSKDGKVISSGDNPFGYNIFITSDGRARIEIDTIDNSVLSAYGTTDIRGGWHHIAIVYDSSDGSNALYVDGISEASITDLSGAIEYNTEKNIRVGARTDGWYFNGKIDEVKIWNYALTQTEIEQEFLKDSVGDGICQGIENPQNSPNDCLGQILDIKFDEGTGDITIDSIGDNNGTIYGASWTEGISNFGLQFDGIDDYVDLGDDPILKPENVTASAWVNIPLGSSKDGKVISSGDNPFGYNIFITSDGRARIEIDTIDNSVLSAYGTTDIRGGWHHIAIVYDSSDGSNALYVDGISEASITDLSGAIEYNTEKNIRVGARTDGWYFNGKIDEVKIWNYALTQTEIEQEYQKFVICGNNLIEGNEICDGSDLGDKSCISLGHNEGGLTCLSDCSGYDETNCVDYICGNSNIDPGEDCESTNLNGETCQSLGYDAGILDCDLDTCFFDDSNCFNNPIDPDNNATWLHTYSISDSRFAAGIDKLLKERERVVFEFDNDDYYFGVRILNIDNAETNLTDENEETIEDERFNEEEINRFDLNDDGSNDVYIKLNRIDSNEANFTIMKLVQISISSYCGDGTCDSDETCSNCEVDCGECEEDSYCGDGTCDSDETCSNCEVDCGECEEPSKTGIIIFIVILIIAILVVIGIIVFLYIQKKYNKSSINTPKTNTNYSNYRKGY